MAPAAAPPNARTTDDETLVLSWNRGGRYLEIAIARDATYEWSYANANDNVYDADAGERPSASTPVPPELGARLQELY
jgi:hypothetical protein